MFTKDFAGKTVAFGLVWHRIAGDKPSAEIAELSDEYEMSYGLHREIEAKESDTPGVHQVGLCSDKEASGAYSAAAMLADCGANALLIEELADNKYWICAIADHEVLAGADSIIKGEGLEDAFQDLTSMIDMDGDFEVIASFKIQGLLGIQLDNGKTFEDVVLSNNVEPGAAHKIKSLKSVPRAAYMFGALVVALCAGYFLMSPGEKHNPYEDTQDPEPVTNLIQKDKDTLKQIILEGPNEEEILAKAKIEEINWIQEDLRNKAGAQRLASIVKVIEQTPLSQGGWIAETASWVATDNPESVRVEWSNSGMGTVKTLKKQSPSDLTAFSNDGSVASMMKASGFVPDPSIEAETSLNDTSYGRFDYQHDLQSNYFGASIVSQRLGDRKVPIFGLADEAQARQWVFPHKKFTWEVEGSGIDRMKQLAHYLDNSTNMTLTSLTYSFGKDNSWNAAGEIYAK